MRKHLFSPTILLVLVLLPLIGPLPAYGQASVGSLTVLNRNGAPITALADGDLIHLAISLPAKATQAVITTFSLSGLNQELAECTIAVGEARCETAAFDALGWFWGPDGTTMPLRTLEARQGEEMVASLTVQVTPRPVVLVHGFSSSWQAWSAYLGPQGYLSSAGIQGFAVGDGQVDGTMNTGRIDQPTASTNTIAENAAILGRYIDNVIKVTGAQKVDLIGHSMGGLIARYYIDRLMQDRDVAQLIMLGSPMAGSDCANLPAALGLYLPATLEIRPSYVQSIFNIQITHRHGVPFYALAGVEISEPLASPCTSVPSDIAVSLASVSEIPLHVSQMPVLHTELNTSNTVFQQYVLPLLKNPPGGFPEEEDPPARATGAISRQFTRIYTGNVAAGTTQDVTIPIDPNVTVASFALLDTSRSLTVRVHGASGNEIELSPQKNGLIVINDPESMIYLGYGFSNPKPGLWVVTLQTSAQTPATGADYALTASFEGGAQLQLETSSLLPKLGEATRIFAYLVEKGKPVPVSEIQAVLHLPDHTTQLLALPFADDVYVGEFIPRQSGYYNIEVNVKGQSPDGFAIERSAFLTIEVQPASGTSSLTLVLWGLVLASLLALVALWIGLRLKRRRAVTA